MKLTQLLGFAVAMIVLHASAAAQYGRVDISEGTHFEVAFAHVWASPTEKPMQIPVTLLLTARTSAVATVEHDSLGARASRTYDLQAGITRIVVLTTAMSLPVPTAGIERKGITVKSTGPITVATNVAWQGNGNATLHYPVSTWGVSYRAFSYPQDEYGVGASLSVRPGQIVFVASQDDTRITFKAPTPIATAPGLPSVMVANTSYTITLNAHETVTLLAQIQTGKSHKAETDLTGTLITSTKPIAVISGHTKGAVGMKHPVLPPTGLFKAAAHFVRNCFNQVLLPDNLADTLFVTVPLKYAVDRMRTTADEDTVNWGGDVIRILAIEDNTAVRRMRADGTGYDVVATLAAGNYYSDSAVKRACLWLTSKPAHVMQYGKSFGKGLPVAIDIVKGNNPETPQGHPTVESWIPTMIVIPGTSLWINRGTFVAHAGMDTYCSVVAKTADLQDIMLDGKTLMSHALVTSTVLAGAPYTTVVLPVAETMHTISTAVNGVSFMTWSYGSLYGLAQGRSYGHPIGLGVASEPCADTITASSDTSTRRATVTALLTSATSCSKFLGFEIISKTNVVVDSSDVGLDSIYVYVSSVRSDSIGMITVRFLTTTGTTLEHTVTIDSITRQAYRVDLDLTVIDGALAQLCTNTFVATTAIPDHFLSCMVTTRCKDSVLVPLTARMDATDTYADGLRTSRFKFPVVTRQVGTAVAKIEFLVVAGKSADWPVEILGFKWYDADSIEQNVDTRFTRVVPPPPVSVDEDNAAASSHSAYSLVVSPQPATDKVYISVGKGLEGGTLRVYDFTGTLVMEHRNGADYNSAINNGAIELDVSSLSVGSYYVSCSSRVHTVARLVIVR